MNKYEQMAIEMKYEGKTYQEISDALKKAIPAGTIANWFMETGRLYIEYLKYETYQNKKRSEACINIFKKEAENASKVIIQALANALKKQDYDKAVEYAEKILDRGGNVIVKKTEDAPVDPSTRKLTDEQLIHEIARAGIDPSTGARAGTPASQPN